MVRAMPPLRISALAALFLLGCSTPAEDPGPPLATQASTLTVDQEIAKGGCTSSVVQGLSDQILEELTKCLEPGFLVKVPTAGNLVNNANHPFLEKPAADGLKAALATKPGTTLTINSMFRTVAQQYVLYRQASCFPAVATPGKSNHETGLAFDTSDQVIWRTALESNGFKWFGSGDPVHFDYVGAGALDLRGRDVLAYQRLWNRNHPTDKISEDSSFGPETEARLKKSPADGFAIGAVCDKPADAGADAGKPDAADAATDADAAAPADTAKDSAGDTDAASAETPTEPTAGCGCRTPVRDAPISGVFLLSWMVLLFARFSPRKRQIEAAEPVATVGSEGR